MTFRLLRLLQSTGPSLDSLAASTSYIYRSSSSLLQSLTSTSAAYPNTVVTSTSSTGSISRLGSSESAQLFSSTSDAYVGLGNLRDNPKATRQRIRVGRGDAARRGNYSGRGLKGQKARSGSGPHPLFDGGQLGLIKFPISREKPPYEVLYKQLGLARLIEYVQLGLLNPNSVITMKDLYDTGCIQGKIRYGVQLYGKAPGQLRIPPLHLQVTACTDESRDAIRNAGGTVERVYYTEEGITALINPRKYTAKKLPLPPPAHSWHPRYNDKFDVIGQLPHNKAALALATSVAQNVKQQSQQSQQQQRQQQ